MWRVPGTRQVHKTFRGSGYSPPLATSGTQKSEEEEYLQSKIN